MSRFPRPGRGSSPRPRPVPRPTAGPTDPPTPPTPPTTFTLTVGSDSNVVPVGGSGGLKGAPNPLLPGSTIQAPLAPFSELLPIPTPTLGNADEIAGGGGNTVLNATLAPGLADLVGGISPVLSGIPTVNLSVIAATGAAGGIAPTFNGARSTGITTLGDINSAAPVVAVNLTTPLTVINKTGAVQRDTILSATSTALAGAADAVQINLTGITGGDINLTPAPGLSPTNGYETVNINSVGPNVVGVVTGGGSITSTTVTGGPLTIAGSVSTVNGQDFNNAIDASVTSFNASALAGPLNVGSLAVLATGGATRGASVVAPAGAFNFDGSNFGTNLFVAAATLQENVNLDGGTGTTDSLTLTGASQNVITDNGNAAVASTPGQFTATGFETLRVTDNNGNGASGNVNVDLTNVSGVTRYQLNGGNSASVVTFENLTYQTPVNVVNTGTGLVGSQLINGVTFELVDGLDGVNTFNYTFGNRGVKLGGGSVLTSGGITGNAFEQANIVLRDLSVDKLDNDGNIQTSGTQLIVGAPASDPNQSKLTDFTFVADGGTNAVFANIGILGGKVGATRGTLKTASIDSPGAIQAAVNQAAGAQIELLGAGNHFITALLPNRAVEFDGSASTGNLTLTGPTNASGGFLGGSGNDTGNGGAKADVFELNTGADQANAGAADSIVQNNGDSVAATEASIISGVIPGAVVEPSRLFLNGSSITFDDGVDTITGITGQANGAVLTTTAELVLNNFDTDEGLNGTYDQLYVADSSTIDFLADDTIYAGQLITADFDGVVFDGANQGAEVGTFYLQGEFANGVFTVNAGAQYNGVGGGTDLLVFTLGTESFNSGSQTGAAFANEFFLNSANSVILENVLTPVT